LRTTSSISIRNRGSIKCLNIWRSLFLPKRGKGRTTCSTSPEMKMCQSSSTLKTSWTLICSRKLSLRIRSQRLLRARGRLRERQPATTRRARLIRSTRGRYWGELTSIRLLIMMIRGSAFINRKEVILLCRWFMRGPRDHLSINLSLRDSKIESGKTMIMSLSA